MDIKSLFPWFQKKDSTQSFLGLDIGTNEIKLLQINKEKNRVIEYFAIIPLPTGLVEKDVIKDPSGLAQLLKNSLKNLSIPTKAVAIAVPRSAVIIKNASVDARLSPKEIESRAWVEAGQQFPDLIGEINLDYTILGPSPEDSSKLDLVLVACRKEQIKPYLDFIKEAGLQPILVDVNCYAFERALYLETFPKDAAVALLNIDFALTSLVVVQNGIQIYAHDYIYDAKKLMTQLTNEEELKKQPVEAILKDQFSTHLRHVIHFFYSSRHNIAIQQLYLSGDLALLPVLQTYIQNEIGIKTEIAKPCAGMATSTKVNSESIKQLNPALALCCGLALSNVQP